MNILAIDIGGTSIKYAVMDETMRMRSRGDAPTPQEGREELIDAIGTLYDAMKDCDGIAVSMPGIIRPVRKSCNLPQKVI